MSTEDSKPDEDLIWLLSNLFILLNKGVIPEGNSESLFTNSELGTIIHKLIETEIQKRDPNEPTTSNSKSSS
jgi:hypothetical protein